MSGYVGAMLTILAFAPQAYKTIRTRKTRDLSLSTYVVLVSASCCWVVYGVDHNSPVIFVTNIAVGVLALIICVMKAIEE